MECTTCKGSSGVGGIFNPAEYGFAGIPTQVPGSQVQLHVLVELIDAGAVELGDLEYYVTGQIRVEQLARPGDQ